jgi:metal-responsive CopG/Arc/MetJ family transcriptional regulator
MKRILISLPDKLVEEIDEKGRKEERTRTDIIRKTLEAGLR